MSRRYPTAEIYEERERDFYARPRADRNYEEIDIDISRNRYADRPAEAVVSDRRSARQPDFLREDYGRTAAGPLVLREREREREREQDTVSEVRSRRGPVERTQKDELVIRERERRPDPYDRTREREVREVDREEIVVRRGDREPERRRARDRDVQEPDIVSRRGGEPDSRPRPRKEYAIREDIVFRQGDGERDPQAPKERMVEKEEIVFRRREATRSPPAREYDDREVSREEIIIRDRDRSIPPPRRRSSLGPPIAREREEFVFRRREPSPPPQDFEDEEIIIRRMERPPPREPSPEPEREPSPEPVPPIIRPPIVQEIITHHRHIDHGFERARSPSPPPQPPSPPPVREDNLEIGIRRRGIRNGQRFYDEDIIYERDTAQRRPPEPTEPARRRSASGPRRREEIQIDIRRGGGVERKESGRRVKNEMWTEVTKDLVIKEAVDEMGYEYEETDSFFYVIEYLKYDDVLQLVELSEDIRRERRERIREIQWEREELERLPSLPPPPAALRPKYDERIYEREVIYDTRRPGRYR